MFRLLPVPGEGPKNARIMVVGEAPGKEEDAAGHAFVGRSGTLLRQFTRIFGGFELSSCWVTNLVKILPKKEQGLAEEITQAEIERWAPLLWQEVQDVSPDLILCMGRFSFRELTGITAPMEAVHARAWELQVPEVIWSTDRGPDFVGLPVIPAFHPAAGLRDPTYLSHLAEALRVVKEKRFEVKDPEPPYHSEIIWSSTDVDHAFGSKTWRGGTLAMDTEGSASRPMAVSFALHAKGAGISSYVLPTVTLKLGHDPQIALNRLRERLKLHHPTVLLHYALHDLPVLRTLGIDLLDLGLRVEDTQVKAYLLQLEPQGLKNLALRHLHLKMKEFEGMSEWAREDEFREWLYSLYEDGTLRYREDHGYEVERTSEKTGKKLKSKWVDCQCGLCRASDRVVEAMSKPPADWKKFAASMPSEFLEKHPAPVTEDVLGRMWRSCLYRTSLIDYAGEDAAATLAVAEKLNPQIEEKGLSEVEELDLAVQPMLDRMQTVGLDLDMARYSVLKREFENDLDSLTWKIRRCVKKPKLNPASRDQLATLLFEELHVQSGGQRLKLTKGKTRPAVDEEVLEQFRDAHPVVPMLLEYSEVRVLLDSFLEKLPGFRGEDGKIHPRWNATRVVSGRLSCNDPNLLAFPAHSERGVKVRGLFVAPPGWQFFSADLSQIEPRILAHESGDETLIGIFERGEDVYKAMAGIVWNIPLDLVTKTQRQAAKILVLAILYGLTAMGLQAQLTKLGIPTTESGAQGIIDNLLSRFPKVRKYRSEVWAQTRLDGFVRGPSGRIRYLPAIRLSGDSYPGSYLRGEAERQAMNFKIQEGAQAYLKRGMTRIWNEALPDLRAMALVAEPALQIHDELVFLAREMGQEVVQTYLLDAMISERLKVPLKVEGKWAQDWGGLK